MLKLLIAILLSVQICSSQRPTTGVALFRVRGGQMLPNITIINSETLLGGITCSSSLDLSGSTEDIGEWHYPDGRVVGPQRQEPLYTLKRLSRVELHGQSGISSSLEGIYTCRIPDQSRIIRTLYAGIYTPTSYNGQAAPQLNSPVVLNLESPTSSLSTIFTLTCTSSAFPPTEVIWTRNGVSLPPGNTSDNFQVLRNARTTTFDNVLRVRDGLVGNYRCTVNNTRGENSRDITIRKPSETPESITATPLGDNNVKVNWNSLSDIRQYIVIYQNGSDTSSVRTNDTNVTLNGLLVDVTYSITVQALEDLPGPISSPVSITLQVPPPPSIVMASSPSSTSIFVMWRPPSTSQVIRGFEVSYSPANNSCDGIEGRSEFVEGGESTNHTLQGLEEFTKYNIEVRTRGIQGLGLPSPSRSQRTGKASPGSPVNVTVVGSSFPLGFNISWKELECKEVNDDTGILHYIIRYGVAGSPLRHSRQSTSTTFTIRDSNFKQLEKYEFEVGAVNSMGIGSYSSLATAAILKAPGQVANLRTIPGIVSILATWEPPSDQRVHDLITEYEVTYRLSMSGANPINRIRVNRTVNSHRVIQLIPQVLYSISIRAYIKNLKGDAMTSIISTQGIDRVFGVTVEPTSRSRVRVLWRRLSVEDVENYRVYYSLTSGPARRRRQMSERSATFPGNASSGVISNLDNGGQYRFHVVAVVTVSGLEREGQRSEVSVATVEGVRGLSTSAIAGIIIAVVVLVLLLFLFLFLFLAIWWRHRRRGKFVLNKKRKENFELQPPKSPAVTTLPLPDFDPYVQVSKPIIQEFPKDTIILEGQAVTFEPKVVGTPPPTVAWYHNGSIISSDYAMEVKNDGSLVLACAELKHTGTYRFTVSNSAGSVQGQVNLKVSSEADMVSNSDMIDGSSVKTSRVAVSEFVDYVDELHDNNNKGFKDQFLRLGSEEEGHSTKWAQHEDYRHLNRFANITIYDDNRVKLKAISGAPDYQHEYINASYINGYFMTKKFIATQGPMENTVVDFWRLVWQLRTPTIIMLTNLTEAGKEKCTQYWPEADTADYGPFRVVLSGETVYGHYTIRTLHVNFTLKTQSPLKVIQYHYTAWPDHGLPDYAAPMLAFHRRIKTEHKSMLGPMLIHCSAGVGRTGTFIAIDVGLQQASGEDSIDIPYIISNLRKQRMKMVQTPEQFMFIHDAVLENFMCGNTQISVHELKAKIEALYRWDPQSGRSGFQSQFFTLNQISPKREQLPCTVAKENMKKNRYDHHLPVDKHRVILKAEYPDYIHATFVHGYKDKKKFIVTQGPLPVTCRDFWKMVYERDCGSIVMLSGMMEDNQEVCYKYWPTQGIEQYGEYDVSLLEQTRRDGFLERIYSVTDSKSGQAHRVSQFQVINWDQHGVTFNMMAVLNLISCVTSLQRTSHAGPIVVHCSDCVTRSAIFCSVSNCIEWVNVEGVVDIFQVVKGLRNQIPGAIPTVEQYQITHDILLYYIQNFMEQC